VCASGRKQLFVVFLCGFEEKVQICSPNPLGNPTLNTNPLIHNYSFKTKWFNRKTSTENFKGGVSLLLISL